MGGAALLANPSLYLASAETLKDSHVLVWNRSAIRELAARYPRLLENALVTASDYLAWYVAAHVALTSHSAREYHAIHGKPLDERVAAEPCCSKASRQSSSLFPRKATPAVMLRTITPSGVAWDSVDRNIERKRTPVMTVKYAEAVRISSNRILVVDDLSFGTISFEHFR